MGGYAGNYLHTMMLNDNPPLSVQLAQMGFDVWLLNNRGTTYSQVHDTYSVNDSDFWKFDWTHYAVYDFPAAVAEVRKRNGNKKVTMIGHSQGTTQTFAGMGLIPEWYDENLSVAALMGPCTSPNELYFEPVYKEKFWNCLAENDVWVIAGPNWDKLRPIVEEKCCESDIERGAVAILSGLPNNPTMALSAYAQVSISGRFQQPTETWFEEENPKTPLMDFGMVKKMNVALFAGLWDNTCPLTETTAIYDQLGGDRSVSTWVVNPVNGHVPWGGVSSIYFAEQMRDALMVDADI